jgi:hypothetical protein
MARRCRSRARPSAPRSGTTPPASASDSTTCGLGERRVGFRDVATSQCEHARGELCARIVPSRLAAPARAHRPLRRGARVSRARTRGCDRRRRSRASHNHLLKQRHRILPPALSQQHEPRVERRELIARAKLVHSGGTRVPPRRACRPCRTRRRGSDAPRRACPSRAPRRASSSRRDAGTPAGHEPVQRLPHVELAEPGFIDETGNVSFAVR